MAHVFWMVGALQVPSMGTLFCGVPFVPIMKVVALCGDQRKALLGGAGAVEV